MMKLISESAQAAEMADESEWDVTRWRTSVLQCAAPSVQHSKPKKQKQSNDDRKDRIKDSNQMKILNEIRRWLQLAGKGDWYRLLSSHLQDDPRIEKKTRKEEDTPSSNQDKVEKVKCTMDVMSEVHRELESARKSGQKENSRTQKLDQHQASAD